MTNGKASVTNHLFLKGEARSKGGRPEDGGATNESSPVGGTDGWLGRVRLGDSKREGPLDIVSLLRD
jgi:hypothetical protein